MRKKSLVFTILMLGIIGFLVSVYLTWDHYRSENGFLCEITDDLSCDITKDSKYSELFGVPVGVFGMMWFLIMILLGWIEKKREVSKYMLVWGLLGLLFVGYFVHGEYVLQSLCPYCTIAHGCVILIFTASVDLYRQRG